MIAGNDNFSGRLAFILASIGAAVGLGNIWKFPYTLGESGGSAFVLIYLIATLTSSILMLESMTARATEVRNLPRPIAATGIGTVAFLLTIDAGRRAWRW